MGRITMPKWLKDQPDIAKVFRDTVKHLKETGDIDTVDAGMVTAYATAFVEYQRHTKFLLAQGYIYIDKNKQERKRPETLLQDKAFQRMMAASKTLGMDRHYREKGREKATALGEPVDKFARLRKVS